MKSIATLFIFLLLLMLLPLTDTHAQNGNDSNFYWGTGAGMSFTTLRDSGMSPLRYSGNNFSGNAFLLRTRPKSLTEILFTLDYGSLDSQFSSGGLVSNVQFNTHVSYQHLLPLNLPYKIKLHAGGAFDFLNANRVHQAYVNNSYNFEFASILSVKATLSSPKFELFKKTFSAAMSYSLPVVSYTIRPAYNTSAGRGFIMEHENTLEAILNSGKLQSYGSFFHTNQRYALYWHLPNRNRMSLQYHWNYYFIDGHNSVRSGNHIIFVSTYFAFR